MAGWETRHVRAIVLFGITKVGRRLLHANFIDTTVKALARSRVMAKSFTEPQTLGPPKLG